MAENKEYMIHQEEDGAIQISEDVVASIASTTASEVDGVSAMMSANVSDLMGGKKMSLEGMTGFRVAAVNVHVGGISFN